MNHVESSSKIYFTKEYSRFLLLGANRELNQTKVNRLKKTVIEGLNMFKECPVIVVEKKGRLEVIDGQHRFWVCKIMELPVFYVISKEISVRDIAKLNSNSDRWKNADYINLFVQEGLPDYIQLQQFMDEYRIPLSTSLRLLNSGGIYSDAGFGSANSFKNGQFKIKELAAAKNIATKQKLFYRFGKRTSRAFLMAITQLRDNGADLELIAESCRHGADMAPQVYPAVYIKKLEELSKK